MKKKIQFLSCFLVLLITFFEVMPSFGGPASLQTKKVGDIGGEFSTSTETNAAPKSDNLSSHKGDLRGDGLQFTPNKGQLLDMESKQRLDILFAGDDGSSRVYLRKTGISYVISEQAQSEELNELEELKEHGSLTPTQEARLIGLRSSLTSYMQRVDINFVGAVAPKQVATAQPVEGHTSYYYAHIPEGILALKSYHSDKSEVISWF